MEFLPLPIQTYAETHTSVHSALLASIERDTHIHVLKPRMLSGHLQGRLLAMISQMIRPKRILEIGTYTGYSALCLAEGLAADGHLITLEVNAELKSRVEGYFAKSEYSERMEMRIGEALKILPTLEEEWDLVFIDADKKNYLAYYEAVVEQTRPGGIILVDNILWSGKVVDATAKDKNTLAIKEFNEAVHNDTRVANVLLPVRDGLMMLQKL